MCESRDLKTKPQVAHAFCCAGAPLGRRRAGCLVVPGRPSQIESSSQSPAAGPCAGRHGQRLARWTVVIESDELSGRMRAPSLAPYWALPDCGSIMEKSSGQRVRATDGRAAKSPGVRACSVAARRLSIGDVVGAVLMYSPSADLSAQPAIEPAPSQVSHGLCPGHSSKIQGRGLGDE